MGSLFILIPLFVFMLINLPPRMVMRKLAFWAVLALMLLQVGFVLFPSLSSFAAASGLFRMDLAIDKLAQMCLLSIAAVTLAALLTGRALITDENQSCNFMNLLLLVFIGMNGITLVKDIFSMYVFLEVTAVSSFILIAFSKDKDGLEGAFKYIIFSSIATVMILSAIALLLLVAGDTSFAALRAAIKLHQNSHVIMFAISVFLSGLFIKSGLMPFHGWLPDAYSSAPGAASVHLAGIVTKIVGVYPLIRIVHSVFSANVSTNNVLMITGAFSIVVAAFAAINQSDFRRMLAYSSISQVGYIILSLGCGSALGLAAAIFHFFNHSIFKSLLFVNAATVEAKSQTRDINEMGGLAQRMPVTGITSALACLSVSGIPPLSGFWSKLLIIVALWQANQYAYAIIAVMASLVTLSYMLTLQRKVFFGSVSNSMKGVSEADWKLLMPSIILVVIMLVVSLLFPLFLNTFLVPIGGI